jgi:AAA domain/Winged helix-turn-helix DNA-binding
VKSEKFVHFREAIADLEFTGIEWVGTCLHCGTGRLRLAVTGAESFEESCSNGCTPAQIRDGVRAELHRRATKTTNGATQRKAPVPSAEPVRPANVARAKGRGPPPALGPPVDEDIGFWEGPEFDLAEFPEPDWLAPGFIPKGMLSMIVADPKIGKSVLASSLCIAAPTGGMWLGQQIPKTPALYINWEDPPGLTRDRARQQMAHEPLPRGYFFKEPPFGRSVNDMRPWIVRKIEAHGLGLVVIDPLAIAARWENEADPYETGVIMSNLQEIAVKTGAAVVVVHHSTKSGGEWGKEVRGSGGIFGAVMSLLSVKRKADGIFDLDVLNKLSGEALLSLKRDALTLSWQITQRLDADGNPMSVPQIHKEAEKDRCLACIRANPAIEVRDICKEVQLPQTTVSRYVRELITEKKILQGPKVTVEPGTLGGRRPRGHWAYPEEPE